MRTLPFFKPKNKPQFAGLNVSDVSSGGGGDTSSLVNKSDITPIILIGTTNTSGNVISAGTWFYLNGTPCVAKVDIASGATFTEGTNYEEKTVGSALSELNDKCDTIHYTANDIVVADTSTVSVGVVDFSKRSGNFYNIHIMIDISGNGIGSWTQVMTFNPIPSTISSIRILNTSDSNYRLIETSPFYLNGKVIYTNNQSVNAGSYIIQGQQFV